MSNEWGGGVGGGIGIGTGGPVLIGTHARSWRQFGYKDKTFIGHIKRVKLPRTQQLHQLHNGHIHIPIHVLFSHPAY